MRLFIFILVILLALINVSAFFGVRGLHSFHNTVALNANKVPLVAGGKRVEVDEGSSLLAVSLNLFV